MTGWAKGEYQADLLDVTGGQLTRLIAVRLIYNDPGRLVNGVKGNQATINWAPNQSTVTAIGGVGPAGPPNVISIGDIDTLETGEPAEATITGSAPNQVLNLGLPKGNTGATGPSGTITIGDVATGAPGTDVIIDNTGTPENAVLDITIPRGDVGATGAAATIAVGTITTSLPGSDAEVANVGTSGAAIFDFVIPRGEQGPPGSVVDGDKGDITVSGGGTIWTIDNDAVTFDKTQNIATSRMLGRKTASSGSVEELAAADSQDVMALFGVMLNGSVDGTVASNALTVSLKTAAGTAPSADSPVSIPFRSATATDGAVTQRRIAAALDLVISPGSTVGAVNNQPLKLWQAVFFDGSDHYMAVINCRVGNSIFKIGQTGVASTTAEGGAGAADSAGVFYASAALTNKPYTIVGCLEWSAGLAAAGTWATAPTKKEAYRPGMKLPGDIIQVVPVTGGGSSTTNPAAVDVTGADASITPSSAANAVYYAASGRGSVTAGGSGTNSTYAGEIVRSSTILQTAQIGVGTGAGFNGISAGCVSYSGLDWPATTSSTSYRQRHYRITSGSATVSTSDASVTLFEIQS